MNLTVVTEQRFERCPDGIIRTVVGGGYEFWKRYLQVYRHVRVLARVRDVVGNSIEGRTVEGDGVSIEFVGDYHGPWQYLLRIKDVRRVCREVVNKNEAIMLRVPGQLSAVVASYACAQGRPYALEVVGDPHEVFAPGAVRHPLRPFLQWWAPRQLRRICRGAIAAAYVTEHTLQTRYPLSPERYRMGVSDVELPPNSLVMRPRSCKTGKEPTQLITVSSLAQMYKGTDILLESVGLCVRSGLDLRLTVVGDGRHRRELEDLAAMYGLGERVRFLGELPSGFPVWERLDESDLFVLPSLTEGLPRAMIEAMARGLPCIGTNVGGIPELLPDEDMVPPGDVKALARKISEVLRDAGRMERMSTRNLEKSKEYREEVLRERRVAFYGYVREKTEDWIKGKNWVGDHSG